MTNTFDLTSQEIERELEQMKKQHTPTPWRCYYWGSAANEFPDETTSPFVIEFPHDVNKISELETNAAFIAKAVNHHENLIEALKSALDTISALSQDIAEFRERGIDPEGYDHDEQIYCQNRTITEISEALTKAKGESNE